MKWYVDFSGYCMIEANSAEEAEAKFWRGLRPPCKDAFNDVWDIENIESAEMPDFPKPFEANEGD